MIIGLKNFMTKLKFPSTREIGNRKIMILTKQNWNRYLSKLKVFKNGEQAKKFSKWLTGCVGEFN
jgi:hypothetical protein